MISTKWFQGINSINEALDIRKKVITEELKLIENNISDIFDEFAFNAVVYDDENAVGTGRLLFKEGKYFIDNVCVLKEFRGRHYGDLIVRMLVRRAVNMGAEKTYTECKSSCTKMFVNIGFETVQSNESGINLMVMTGDVGGHCKH
ncbi:MAG: family N-acetyltransferase [Sedimentibacter sp.]|jgi:N-acetylglutamate synthase-like GNAT family acetyltransferase|nr:family N-acetyltransferase [Sedimentibacter sp.]